MISYRKEPQGLDFLSAYGVATDEDSDYDYDEYEFLPSISPSVLFPVTNRLGLLPPLAEECPPRVCSSALAYLSRAVECWSSLASASIRSGR